MSDSFAAAPRSLPQRPDLDHLRGQAKTLLDLLRAGDPAAIERAGRALPHRAGPWRLADAQAVVAREYGFKSWPKLIAHVKSLRASADLRERLVHEFKSLVTGGDVAGLAALLARDPAARDLVNVPIFDFGGRAVSRVRGNAELLDLLLAHGADLDLKSEWWAGPWGVLETASAKEAELFLSRGATIDIFAAANLDRVDLMRSMLDADPRLVDARGGDGCRPLHFAKSAAAMDLLLSRGAAIEARDVDHGSTALQWALPRVPGSAHGGVRPAGAMDRCRLLAGRGATVDIFAAAAMDEPDLVRQALDAHAGAIAARVNTRGYPLCPVAPGGHIYLFTLGGGLTPHAVAAAFGSEAALAVLMERSTPRQRLVAACVSGRSHEAKAMLQRDSSLLDSLGADDRAALPIAAWNADAKAVMAMLDIGFDPLAAGPDTGTALHCAAWRGLAELVEAILAHPRILPIRDRLIAAKDATHGGTPLGWCCHGSMHCRNPDGDYARAAKALVAAGAEIGTNGIDASDEVRAALGMGGSY